MKKINHTLLYVAIFSTYASVLFSSCNDTKDKGNTKEVAEEHNEAKFSNSKEDDAALLVSAAVINLEEIQLGKLAQVNSKTNYVIELGKMMETEHLKAQNELKELADKKQITLPTTLTEDEQASYRSLLDKFGNTFNKEYCDKMVQGHKDAVEKFDKASTNASDTDIRAWAASMLPILRKHLDHAITCQMKCEKK